MPNSSRPFERWSTVATSSANRSGWLSGSTWTAMPILIRRVQAASAAATTSGDDSTERSFWKWISASQTASRPSASAAFICARDSSKAVAWLIPAGASNSVNRPNSIPPSRGERHLSYTRPNLQRLARAAPGRCDVGYSGETMTHDGGYRLGVDVGGTFTDLVLMA